MEEALRFLGRQVRGDPAELLEHAIRRPQGTAGAHLDPLISPTRILDDWSPRERADAIVQLLFEGVHDGAVGPTARSRRRRVLLAAFRFPDPEIKQERPSSLTGRFNQLKALKSVFGQVTSTQPMEIAWKRGVRSLAIYLEVQFESLIDPAAWEPYRSAVSSRTKSAYWATVDVDAELASLRPPSAGAQPFLVYRFVTTVFMKGRAIQRRLTERVVMARLDDVEFYVAHTYSGGRGSLRDYVPVRSLWGCVAESLPRRRASDPLITRLKFPRPLMKGDMASFASEAWFSLEESEAEDRDWIDVDIDHHGIVQGQLTYDGTFPSRGLTIRVIFDDTIVPVTAWWYAEATEHERLLPPPTGDRRLLQIVDGEVSHTFLDAACQPRESYGISFQWPMDDENT